MIEFLNKVYSPALIYDFSQIENRLLQLQKLADLHQVSFYFPIKSFPNSQVVQLATNKLGGVHICAASEIQFVSQLPEDLLFNSDSPVQCELFVKNAKVRKKNLIFSVGHPGLASYLMRKGFQVILRVKVSGQKGENQILSRFGISPKSAIEFVKSNSLSLLKGFHFHLPARWGSHLDSLKLTPELQTLREFAWDPPIINWGGGMSGMSFESWNQLILNCKHSFPNSKHIFEPGLWLSERSGWAITTVESQIEYNKFVQLSCDVSFLCHLRWSNPILRFSEHFFQKPILLCGPTSSEDDIFFGNNQFERDDRTILSSSIDPFKILLSGINGYSYAWNGGFGGIGPAHIYFTREKRLYNFNESFIQ